MPPNGCDTILERQRAITSGAILIGVLAPLTEPGWMEAGHHLLAGHRLAADDVNLAGGVSGKPLHLLVRDTAADPQRAAQAISDLACAGVSAVGGEYHSVAARAAAVQADALCLPFLCSSAVLDPLTDHPTEWVARLAPPQSNGWRAYADFLLDAGHSRVAVVADPSAYWAAGSNILRDRLAPCGCTFIELEGTLAPKAICDELARSRATALLLLVGYPDPAVSIVEAVRADFRLAKLMVGAPAGQPEFAGWGRSLGVNSAGIPFLRYLPSSLTPLGARVERDLRERLGCSPSFVAFEGYDTIAILANMLNSCGARREQIAESWSRVSIEGTRGQIQLSRPHGRQHWQWEHAPIQIAARDYDNPAQFRVFAI